MKLKKNELKNFKAINENDIVFAIGPASTGKTYQAVASAVDALKNKNVDKIIITKFRKISCFFNFGVYSDNCKL